MRITDSCKCGAQFSVRAIPANAGSVFATWLNVHAACRGDRKEIVVEARK